jgi:putative ABC transport system permease protein
MNIFLSAKQFLNDLRRQKLRSIMTMFGIFWGTCSIVLLFAFGKGITEAQLKSQKGMGENIVIFWPGITAKEFQGLPKGRRIQPTDDDVAYIKKHARTIEHISPENGRNMTLKFGKQTTQRFVDGVWPEYGIMRNLIPREESRFINDLDMKNRRRVIFLGDKLADDLFGDSAGTAIGREILVNDMPFVVVGIMKSKEQDSSYRSRDDRSSYIPNSTYQAMFSERYSDDFVAQCKPQYTGEIARKEVFKILGEKYRFDPDDDGAMSVWDTTEGFAFLKNFFYAFSGFLVAIGIATLITGGIGVTNIMNVVLEERTKEIGIKMALGARKSTILFQFVFETLLITAVGGLLGFLFGVAIVKVVPMFGGEEFIGVPQVDIWASVGVVIILGLIGLLAGIFPARRAANLQPVQALKLF